MSTHRWGSSGTSFFISTCWETKCVCGVRVVAWNALVVIHLDTGCAGWMDKSLSICFLCLRHVGQSLSFSEVKLSLQVPLQIGRSFSSSYFARSLECVCVCVCLFVCLLKLWASTCWTSSATCTEQICTIANRILDNLRWWGGISQGFPYLSSF